MKYRSSGQSNNNGLGTQPSQVSFAKGKSGSNLPFSTLETNSHKVLVKFSALSDNTAL
ncbi:hypothetical protein [Vibrio mimicus]|uniref:hypothetical protein n=1 Tax=Vibrio mimicus TaxID=674 RepID=UPI0002288F47|nr:hypothetical protein [Vibrio mimicus]EGU19955.1 hypothetical protein SX4_2603 [Vibrio mimicus SX-4]